MGTTNRITLNIPLRVTAAFTVQAIVFALLILRLWYLQVNQGDYYRELSENNRIRTVFTRPPRGLILDRNGELLAGNRPAFNIELISEDSPDPEASLRELARVIEADPAELIATYRNHSRRRRFEPKVILRDVDRDLVARVAAHRHKLPGVVILSSPTRTYPHGMETSHLVGYVREVSSRQLESPEFTKARTGDWVGQSGIEREWEYYLQGERGLQQVIVNAKGSRIREASYQEESAGKAVTLTIDIALQQAALKALGDRGGAVVALDPRNGEVLALVSAPSFDPNSLTGGVSKELWAQLNDPKHKRLNNRPVQGGYPPGSVFKIVMAIAGQSEGVISPSEKVFCPGYFYVGSRRFRCHKLSGHGAVDAYMAMVQSCDVYFYTVGTRLGVDRIHQYAERLGFNSKTGIKLGDEKEGLIPSTAWKRRAFRREEDKKWYPGETPSVSIGQGAVVTTPIQIARSLAAVVNGGKLLRPRLVKRIASEDGSFVDEDFQAEVQRQLDLDPQIMKSVVQSLQGVVNDDRGTGRRARLPKEWNITVGGKTGTAQVVAMDRGFKGEHFEDHAWFAGFAPVESPEIVVAAIVENGGHGGAAAAPVVQQVMAAWFAATRNLQIPAAAPAPVVAGGADAD